MTSSIGKRLCKLRSFAYICN